MRFVVSIMAAVLWAVAVTAAERHFATWAPNEAWRSIALANFAVVAAVSAVILLASRRVFASSFAAAIAVSLALVPLNIRGPGPV